MKKDKYTRNINLLCPTCGSSLFEYEKRIDESIEVAKCVSCGRLINKDELIRENSENINEHTKEIAGEVVKDFVKEFKASMKKAFRGNKNIRIK